MSKPETLAEAIETFDCRLSGPCDLPSVLLNDIRAEWPRLRDSIVALREYVEQWAGPFNDEVAQRLLARLDSPEKRYRCSTGCLHETEEGAAYCDAYAMNGWKSE